MDGQTAATTTVTPADRSADIFTASARSENRRSSGGYSRFVSFMKFLLPATALLLIVLVVVWPQLDFKNQRFGLRFAKLQATEGDVPAMVNARFVGSDRKEQRYTITADLARNLLFGGKSVELEMPKADITARDGSWIVLTANSGVYDQDSKKLGLEGSVKLFHDAGYEFNTKAAQIDLGLGNAESNFPVRGQGPFGQLEAQGFRLENKGQTIYFTGKSKLVIFPKLAQEAR